METTTVSNWKTRKGERIKAQIKEIIYWTPRKRLGLKEERVGNSFLIGVQERALKEGRRPF